MSAQRDQVSALVDDAIFVYLEFYKGRVPMGGDTGADAKIAKIKDEIRSLVGSTRPEEGRGQWSMDVGLAMVRDAERYRFIRSEASHTLNGAWADITDPACNDEKMDAAIDKAMSAGQLPQGDQEAPHK